MRTNPATLIFIIFILALSGCGEPQGAGLTTTTTSLTTTTSVTTTTLPSGERRSFPDTSNGIFVFNDQLAGYMTEAQYQFAATHYVGCQKMTRSDTRRLRGYNPNFIVLHYRLGIGMGYQVGGSWIEIIEGDSWVREWPDTQQDSWFFPYGGATRVLKADEGWYLMDISSSTWRSYWSAEVLRQLESNENDGLFADVFIVPNYLGNSLFDPDLPAIDAAFETDWSSRLHAFTDYMKAQFAGRYYFMPNIGALINSRDITDYTNIDGAMIENFCAWGEGDYFDLSDWQLHMNRILALVNLDKVIMAQPYLENASNITSRLFYLASYLLIKGSHTYINIDMGYEPEYFPEYDIDLGLATESAGSDIANLYVDAWQVYRRRFENGMVLVNPSGTSRTVDLGGTYYQATPAGGGLIPADADISSWRVDYSAVTSVILEPYSGAVLLNSIP